MSSETISTIPRFVLLNEIVKLTRVKRMKQTTSQSNTGQMGVVRHHFRLQHGIH